MARGGEIQGWLEPDAMPVRFASCRVAAIPWRDSPANQARSSVKVREMMAAGLPVVATAVGELPEVLGDGAACVPPGDWPAFAREVVRLLQDRQAASTMGARGRSRVMEHYTWDRLAQLALCAYEGRLAG
jgi:glycosyltransferase involved in cell wall biosynthesis